MLDAATFAKAALSLVLVICLILLTAHLLRWWQNKRIKLGETPLSPAKPAAQPSLEIIATRMIDMKRKLVLIRCGDRQHLLLCGDGHDIVIETGIPDKATDATEHAK